MSQENYIGNLLNIKDKNIKFYKNFCEAGIRKGKKCKFINAYLSYIPTHCEKCGVIFDSKDDYEKKRFSNRSPYVLIPKICKFTAYLKLDKQRIKCHHCNQSFTCKTDLVDFGCFISNPTKLSIASDLIKKEVKKISPLIMMFLLILLKELLTLIMILKNFISIIYPMFYALMNSNLLNLLMVS